MCQTLAACTNNAYLKLKAVEKLLEFVGELRNKDEVEPALDKFGFDLELLVEYAQTEKICPFIKNGNTLLLRFADEKRPPGPYEILAHAFNDGIMFSDMSFSWRLQRHKIVFAEIISQ